MPGGSRLLVVAVSSLLVGSAFAGVIYPRDSKTGEHGVILPQYRGSPSDTLNSLPEGKRFRRYKRQEIPLDEGTLIAPAGLSMEDVMEEGAADGELETTEEVVETTETTTITEEPPSDDTSADDNAGPPVDDTPPSESPQMTMGDSQLPDGGYSPSPPADIPLDEFAADAPPLVPDGTGDPKDDVANTQKLIAESRKELENDDPEMSQQELDDMATAVELISADLSKRDDPATVNVEERVKSEMDDWDNLSEAEKREAHEKALYSGVTQELEMTAVVGNLLGIAEKVVNGDVKTNATEGLAGIQSEDVPNNSTDVEGPIDIDGPSSRLRKRSLQKRFLIPALLGLMGVSAKFEATAKIDLPILGSYAVGLTTGIAKATNAEPPKPQEKIVFVEREVQRQEPQQNFNQPQQSFQQQSFRQESFRQSQQPSDPVTQYDSRQPKSTTPGWDNTYQQNQGFRQNGGFTQTRQSWKKSRRLRK
ncbi:hypothetical protein TWF718_011057 [Orbilia javanica]|uniref:Uncharacterized protein n=1 Tax=Orbilia javanica TaxID=47235 RepID=A0AAN8NNB3_9PEZI